MKNPENHAPVGGETIVILGSPRVPGDVLFKCLTGRGYLPIKAAAAQDVRNLFEHALVSALIIMDSVAINEALTLCKQLRRINHITPIIALLNDADRSRGIEFLEAGADHYEGQPIRVEQLLRALAAFSRRTLRPPDQMAL